MAAAHLKLLKHMRVDWNNTESGAPMINPKRPYGNSHVVSDMTELIGSYGDEQEMMKLHRETADALQIVLVTGKFEIGDYERDQYGINWKKVR